MSRRKTRVDLSDDAVVHALAQERDFTLAFCQMYGPPPRHGETPIYSFDRVAHYFWSGLMNGLIGAGLTENEARDWCASKEPRWALDGDLGSQILQLGYRYGHAAAAVTKLRGKRK